MPLSPFTPEGVQNKLRHLYAKPDEELLFESNWIEVAFVEWMKGNFDLTDSQQEYLSNINEEALNYYGSQCALCFRHRLEIILIYPTPLPGYAKLLETKNNIQFISDDQGNIEVTGSLTFMMIYRN